MYSRIKNTELGIKDIFNIGFSIFTSNFKCIALLGLLVYLPIGVIYMLIPTNASISFTLGILLMHLLIYTLLMPIIYSFVTSLLLELINGRDVKFKNIIKITQKKIGKLIITEFMYNLIIGSMMILIVPGIYFGVSVIFYPCIIAVSDKWGFGAFKESINLVKGRWFKTLFFLLLIFLFSMMIENFLYSIHNIFTIGILNAPIFILATFVFIQIINIYFKLVFSLWFLNKYFTIYLDKESSKVSV